jgi:hypothetical protein
MRGARIALGVIALIAWVAIRASRPSRSYYVPPTIPSLPTFPSLPASLPSVPALEAGDAEGLSMHAVTERAGSGRRIRLLLGGGEATLTMSEPKGASFAFGRGEILPGERESGAKFVAAFASWLGKSAPPAHKGELEPFAFSFARLGSDGGWEANKLFFERDKKYAEVFLNISRDGTRARFLEKDEEYRGDLVALLAAALRDGVAPRHTPADDPNLSTAEPLAAALAPLADARGAKRPVFAPDGSFLAQRGPALLVWSDPAKPPRVLARFDGTAIGEVRPAPKGGLVAITVVHTRSTEFMSSEDPAEVQIRALADGAERGRIGDGVTQASFVEWSPDGDTLALTQYGGNKTLTRLFAADGTPRGECHAAWCGPKRHDPAQHLGPNRVIVAGDDPMVRDLSTHKLRYLFARGAWRFEAASSDGTLLLASGADEQLRFARLQ